jgi:glycosyltransferase involved in cell wall biosynthesis
MILSIVTPSYNQGQFLAETIESVISQQGDFFIDYLIVDGGSSDDSVAVIKRYDELLQQGKWPVSCRGITYRWLSEKDRGQTDALTKGFRLAKGELLAWLNSDDTYLPGALQAAARFFLEHPETGLMYGEAHYCDAAGNLVGSYRTADFVLENLAPQNFICQPSTFFRKEVLEAVGGLDETLHFAMDYDLWVRIGKRFVCRRLPQFLSVYRLHEASKTISDATLCENIEEGLRQSIKHFDWAPITRVYALCCCRCRTGLPPFLARRRTVVIGAAIVWSMFRSLLLNRGIRRSDLRLFNKSNFGKLFKSRSEIMLGSK